MIAVFWSETAKNDYWDNIDYLQQNGHLLRFIILLTRLKKLVHF